MQIGFAIDQYQIQDVLTRSQAGLRSLGKSFLRGLVSTAGRDVILQFDSGARHLRFVREHRLYKAIKENREPLLPRSQRRIRRQGWKSR